MTLILVDRRKAGKGKSTNNRHKLIKRIKNFIKHSVPQNIGAGGVTGVNAQSHSPVKVAGDALEEPSFVYATGTKRTVILPGNDKYDRGDRIEIISNDGVGSGGAGRGDGGEDDFIVDVARNEFLELFFEDCELPNLIHEKTTDRLENKFQQAGFSTTGSPAQLSIVRSYKQSLSRRWALTAPHKEELEALSKELAESSPSEERRAEILARIEELKLKISALDNFDKVDLRYKKREAKPLKTTDAVLIMIMDISGSMGQQEKTIARRWFALLYAFIKRRYGNTDLIFIAHTDEPYEMSEDDFFSTRINGGTLVSPALALAKKIILERYDPNQTNIYIAHASDGDNWDDDNSVVIDEMIGQNSLMNKIQMFSYVEVGKRGAAWFSPGDTLSRSSNLWEAYDECRLNQPEGKVFLSIIETPDDCYPVFKKVFKKQNK